MMQKLHASIVLPDAFSPVAKLRGVQSMGSRYINNRSLQVLHSMWHQHILEHALLVAAAFLALAVHRSCSQAAARCSQGHSPEGQKAS